MSQPQFACDFIRIQTAYDRIKDRVIHTPLLNSPALDAKLGRRLFLKAEALQKTGSFKYRGASAALSALDQAQLSGGVLAFSSGNHAQGIALAAQEKGATARIIMPQDAPQTKIENTRAYGADVILYDRAGGEDRDKIGQELAMRHGAHLIRPFDDPDVISGQASVGLEIAQDVHGKGIEAADVLVCCGGGGLTSGVALALAKRAPDLRVRPVEPEGFDDVCRSLRSGQIEENARPSGSICDAIVTQRPGTLTFPILAAHCGPGLVVSDEDALRAMAVAWFYFKVVLEPGGAVALAAALYQPTPLQGTDVIAIATGGNVDSSIFTKALALKHNLPH